MNDKYCIKLFSEIYSDAASRYRFCCHANTNSKIEGMNVSNTLPFDFFRGPEMEQIRKDVLNDKPIAGCEVCYKSEARCGRSYRTEYNKDKELPTTVQNIDLKLRIFGTLCNLGCYMCIPFDSSTRRKELQQSGLRNLWNSFDKEAWSEDKPINLGATRYQEIEDNLIANIDYCKKLRFYGGEPLMLPRMWSFLKRIPKDKAKNIEILISTNLTQTTGIDWIKKNFKRLILKVSADHFGKRLAWIRYPIDVDQFERNLELHRNDIDEITCSVSILNVHDLEEIEKHYSPHKVFFDAVHNPIALSIRNLPNKNVNLYIPNIEIANELNMSPHPQEYDKGQEYIRKLEKHRGLEYV